jgi:hypothetical protein
MISMVSFSQRRRRRPGSILRAQRCSGEQLIYTILSLCVSMISMVSFSQRRRRRRRRGGSR